MRFAPWPTETLAIARRCNENRAMTGTSGCAPTMILIERTVPPLWRFHCETEFPAC